MREGIGKPMPRRGSRLVPAKGSVLLIVGQDQASIAAYTAVDGTAPGGVMGYTSIDRLEGLAEATEYGSGVQHLDAVARRYPDSAIQIGLWMVGSSEKVAAGAFDANIDRLADWMASIRAPVYLRIGYEFDLPANGYAPESYVAAFRAIAARIRSREPERVALVWHSYSGDTAVDLAAWYPGDDVVDWCAVSFFDQGDEYFAPMADFARNRGKPLMIGEATPKGIGTADAAGWLAWFDRLLALVRRADVRALSYINADWEKLPMFQNQGWFDSRIQADPAVSRRWFEETRKAGYLRASPALLRELSAGRE